MSLVVALFGDGNPATTGAPKPWAYVVEYEPPKGKPCDGEVKDQALPVDEEGNVVVPPTRRPRPPPP